MMRLLVVAVALFGLSAQAPASRAEIAKHRAARVAEVTARDGWLAVRGLFWLHEGANTAGSDPASEIKLPARTGKRVGVFTLANGEVSFTADPGATVTAGGKPVTTLTFARGAESSIVTEAPCWMKSTRTTNLNPPAAFTTVPVIPVSGPSRIVTTVPGSNVRSAVTGSPRSSTRRTRPRSSHSWGWSWTCKTDATRALNCTRPRSPSDTRANTYPPKSGGREVTTFARTFTRRRSHGR